MTERRGAPPPAAAPVDPAPTASVRGFRPGSRRRARIAAGVALAAVAIGGNALVYATLDDRVEVVQVVRDIPAGDTIEATDLRVVGADVDETVPVVHADAIDTVIGSYARTAIGDGSLLHPRFVQSRPLVTSGSGVVAVEIRPSRVPSGVVERSRVLLVVQPDGEGVEPFTTTGRIVARDLAASSSDPSSLSVEIAEADAPRVAVADDVRVVLLEPAVDPAFDPGGES